MNAFLHNVYKKYKYVEYMSKRKVKFGQRFAFLCRLIGRCKTIAYNARLRVSGRKVIKFAKHYISQFRERKRLKIQREIHANIQNYAKMDKIAITSRIIIFKVVKI